MDRPDNDSCETATFISTSSSFLDDTTGSFADFDSAQCSVTPDDRGIWYTFIGEDGTVDIVISAATFNGNLVAFSGECDLKSCIGNNNGSGFAASLSLPTVAGVKYNILVTGVNGFNDVGTYNINFSGDIALVDPPTRAPTPAPVAPPTDAPSSDDPDDPAPSPDVPECKSNILLLLLQLILGWIGLEFCVL